MKSSSPFGALALLCFYFTANGLQAEPLDRWHWRNPLPTGNPLRGVTWGRDQFVAVGEAGTILTSRDGITWTQRFSGTDHPLSRVAFGNNRFVAVGKTGAMVTSADGVAWTKSVTGAEDGFLDIAYGNNRFVALAGDPFVGAAAAVLVSTDGLSWTGHSLEKPWSFHRIAFGNGQFVAVGDENISLSTDGVSWTRGATNTGGLRDVTYGDGQFVAVGESATATDAFGSGVAYTSPDGRTWTRHALETPPLVGILYAMNQFIALSGPVEVKGAIYESSGILTSPDGVHWTRQIWGYMRLSGLAYGNNQLVAVGESDGYGCAILSSPDGLRWTDCTSDAPLLSGVAYGKGRFVAVGATGYSTGTIQTSLDGITWTNRVLSLQPVSVVFGDNQFVAVDRRGTILTSPDGLAWDYHASGASSLDDIAYVNHQFVAIGTLGNDRMILRSPDARTWTSLTIGTRNWLTRMTYGKDLYVAVVSNRGLVVSPDAITWTANLTTTNYSLSDVAYGQDRFVAVGGMYYDTRPLILSSPDGITWTECPVALSDPLRSVDYVNGLFVAAGWAGTIMTSPDGITWTRRNSGSDATLVRVAYGHGQYLAVGSRDYDFGVIVSSADGITWTNNRAATLQAVWGNSLSSIAYGNRRLVTVGASGLILTSTDGIHWTLALSGLGSFSGTTLRSVIYHDGQFVAVGDGGAILTSGDGLTWTHRPLESTESLFFLNLNAVAWGNGQYVAVGFGGATSPPTNAVIFTSTDAVTWRRHLIGQPQKLKAEACEAVAYGDGRFVAVGSGVWTSLDGITWTDGSPETHYRFGSIAYGKGLFITVYEACEGGGSVYWTSPDGLTWTQRDSGGYGLSGITYLRDRFWALDGSWGDPKHIVSSSDGIHWTVHLIGSTFPLNAIGLLGETLIVVGEFGAILQSGPLPPIESVLGLPVLLSPDRIQLSLTGEAGRTYAIQASTNLADWLAITNVALTNASGQFIDPAAVNFSRRFYRAIAR